jgi:hypothetical protein
MTAKTHRYEANSLLWTEIFDLRMDFVGDFSVPPTVFELQAPDAEEKFVARCYQGTSCGALLCHQHPREVESPRRNCATPSANKL